ncbi:MAG: hypothetical protein KY455_09815 [Euryarchaeota archaeon]|nr:hypothetical protein [Euryarchaeota archaeon]
MTFRVVRSLPLFVALAGLLLATLPAQAEDVTTQATVQNATPALLTWHAHWDPATEAYTYAVASTDGNGVEDLIAIHIRLHTADGTVAGETTDAAVTLDGRSAAHWAGTITTAGFPVVAELTITDASGGLSQHVRPVVPLDVSTGPVLPLAQDVQTTTTASLPAALVLGLVLLGRARRHDRRFGGPPGRVRAGPVFARSGPGAAERRT